VVTPNSKLQQEEEEEEEEEGLSSQSEEVRGGSEGSTSTSENPQITGGNLWYHPSYQTLQSKQTQLNVNTTNNNL